MTENNHSIAGNLPKTANPTLKKLDRLVGTWKQTGGVEGDTLTIWGGEKGSPAYYRGTFSEDGDKLAGGWVFPGGGGYEATTTRVK